MADTVSFDSLLNTTSGMTAIVNNTKHDDDTISVTGVNWFTYAGKTASTIYVSGNNFIGFGQNAQQLKICNRDGAVYYIYRQEGALNSGKKFLKIRVEGYTSYSSTLSSYALKYEIFLIEGQTLFVNVIQVPSNSSYIGISSITDGTTTTSLTISTTSTVPIYILVKGAGSAQKVTYEKFIDIIATGISVTTLPNKTTYYQKELFDSTGLSISATYSDGSTEKISNYELTGFDSTTAGVKTITVAFLELATSFEVTVLEDAFNGISVTTLPNKTGYHINGAFSADGIVVSASTSDGKTVVLNPSKLKYSGFDSSSPKQNEITIIYGTFECTFNVTIMQPERISELSYTASSYFVGDTTSVKVSQGNIVYSDGNETVTNGFTVKNVLVTEAGQEDVLIEYFGLTYHVSVDVYDSFFGYIGNPNVEDVTVNFDLESNILRIEGTGEFNARLYASTIGAPPESLFTRATQIIFSDGITKIPSGFAGGYGGGFKNLQSIVFSDTITKIESGTFYNYLGTSIEFPTALTEIGSGSFTSCPNLTGIIFHEGLETISPGSFNSCPSLKQLTLPTTLKDMIYDFTGSDLENLEVGSDDALFANTGGHRIYNISAKNMIIRGGTISDGVFSSKDNIESLTLSGSVKWNNGWQFASCQNLSTLFLEDGITSIPDGCFASCTSLNNIVLPDSVTQLGQSAFIRCSSLKNIVLSPNIVSISDYCFESCAIEEFSIPDDSKIEALGNGILRNCPISNIYIGKSVKTILPGCFSNMNSLTLIRINQIKNSINGAPWSAANATVEWLIKVTKIEVISEPTKLKYKKGESFDRSGLVVKATYSDETSKEVEDYTLSYPDMGKVGNQAVTVEYDGQKTAFDILVIDISKIEVTTMPSKTEYLVNSSLDTTGLVISTVYTDGSKETITGYSLSELGSDEPGEKTITVTYLTFATTFTVTVVAYTAGIRITHYPDKVYYAIGEILDTTGLTVAKYREDGTEVEITDYTLSGFDSSKTGSKTVTVMYTDMSGTDVEVYSTDFQVRITKDGQNPFDSGEQIDVTVHWIDGEFEDLTNEHIQNNTLTLQESICSESYFIFGGCVSNQITFQAHHEQFDGTDEDSYPSGRIEVYLECKGTKIKIFTGEIASADRQANSLTRSFVAYDYLYKLRNTDIVWWYKNQTKDKSAILTQKQFRDLLFEYLGIEQVETTLHWDKTYVPNTNYSSEMNVANVLKDLCLQNDRFGWMNRDGKFEYLKLRQNSEKHGETTSGKKLYRYYNNEEVHLDTFKSFQATEGRIWFPNIIFTDPDPNRAFGFTQGDYTAQEAYENNVYYNRNSFFVGNEDWLNCVWDADEYGGISRVKPIMKICYGTFVNQDLRKYYRAQGYTAEVAGNPFNTVGQGVELYHSKQIQHDNEEPVELQWYVHSYIMSRTLKVGVTGMIDTYSANNAPFNSNSQQLGKYTPEISGTVNVTRSEMPTISYAEFSDGSDSGFTPQAIDDFTDGSDSTEVKKAQLRCMKRIKKSDYDALVAAGNDRKDTLYFTFEES